MSHSAAGIGKLQGRNFPGARAVYKKVIKGRDKEVAVKLDKGVRALNQLELDGR
jgi:hypothetical protein